MNARRRALFSLLADLAVRLSANRPDQDDQQRRVRRCTYAGVVSRWPLRMSEFLRGRLRPRWLRLRK